MGDNRYRISEAAKKLNVEDHVLRYWEEDLGMDVPRNELGHRYYTDVHIDTFLRIKEMKEQGYQLKEIRQRLLQEGNETLLQDGSEEVAMTDARALSADRLEQFQNLMIHIVAQAIETSNEQLSEEVSSRVSEKVLKEMNYLMRVREEREEERYRKRDEVRRTIQKGRKLQAETPDKSKALHIKKKRSLFGRGKNTEKEGRKKTRLADIL